MSRQSLMNFFFGTKPRISHLRTFCCPVIVRKWTASNKSNGKQTERGVCGIYIGLDMHQKGYVIYCPDSRVIAISENIIFDEHFSSAIAHTWQKYHDGITLCPLLSHIPNADTTIEQTGTLATKVEDREECR